MKFGVCTSVENAALLARDGWDYVEDNVQNLLRGQHSDADWNGLASTRSAALPVRAANCLVPGSLKIVGENVDEAALARYMETVCERAAQIGIEILVFGSGDARNIPDGFRGTKHAIRSWRFCGAAQFRWNNTASRWRLSRSIAANATSSIPWAKRWITSKK